MKASDVLRDHQTQLDADGTMVGVSRKALCEVLDELSALLEAAQAVVDSGVREYIVLGGIRPDNALVDLQDFDNLAALLPSKEISDE